MKIMYKILLMLFYAKHSLWLLAMPRSLQQLASRLTFRQLQVFLAVYQQESYSKAGQALGLTQPAVSSQVRQLEDAINQPLFEYVGRKLYHTAAAKRLASTVEKIFDELSLLQGDLMTQAGQVAGTLNLAAVNTAQYVVPYMVKGFIEKYPQVKISVRVGNRANAIQRLQDNSDDLIIMGMVPDDKPFESLPFLDNELVAVAAAKHPLASKETVSARKFLNGGLLMREQGSGSRLALEVFCQEQRLNLEPLMLFGSNDALKHAILAGIGVGVVPKLSILPELQLGTLKIININGFPLRRSWCVVYPKAKHPTPAMKAFIDYTQENIRGFSEQFKV